MIKNSVLAQFISPRTKVPSDKGHMQHVPTGPEHMAPYVVRDVFTVCVHVVLYVFTGQFKFSLQFCIYRFLHIWLVLNKSLNHIAVYTIYTSMAMPFLVSVFACLLKCACDPLLLPSDAGSHNDRSDHVKQECFIHIHELHHSQDGHLVKTSLSKNPLTMQGDTTIWLYISSIIPHLELLTVSGWGHRNLQILCHYMSLNVVLRVFLGKYLFELQILNNSTFGNKTPGWLYKCEYILDILTSKIKKNKINSFA